jgi:hypothetical protein
MNKSIIINNLIESNNESENPSVTEGIDLSQIVNQ